jgi:hypothetical protein
VTKSEDASVYIGILATIALISLTVVEAVLEH